MVKEEELLLPTSDDEEGGVTIFTNEVMEDLQFLDKIKLEQETPIKFKK